MTGAPSGPGAPSKPSSPSVSPAPGIGQRRGPMGGGPPGMGAMMPAEKSKAFGPSFRRLLGELRPERWRIGLVMLFAIVSVAFAVIGPRVLGDATDLVFEGVVGRQLPPGMSQAQVEAMLRASGQDQLAEMLSGMTVTPGAGIDFEALARILGLLVVLYLVSSVFAWAQAYVMAGVTQRTVYRLRRRTDEKLSRLPLRYFDDHQRGDLLSRVTNDIENISQTLQQSLTQLITAVFTVVGVLLMMILISPVLSIIALLSVPASFAVMILIARRSQKQFVAQWATTGSLNAHVEEMHTGHSIVKVFGRQEEAVARFDEHNAALYESSYRAQFISGLIQPSMNIIANVAYVLIAVIGGLMVANGQLTIGAVQAFVQYSRQFTMPIVQTASILNLLQSAVASAERVFELLDEPEEVPDPVAPAEPGRVAGRVAFEGVSFRYKRDQPLIDDLDLVVEPGHTIAIVGPTGAGKTTLVNLLLRFYELDAGRITIDGTDTREMRRDDLRRVFGMVLQDTWLFSGTIRENIAYGAMDATEERIMEAARAAHVDHVVRTMELGYDTLVDDEASNLSQGERQLLTIARAFLADPRILILDEATSSVDTRTEVLVQRAMRRLMEGRTTFVIAHRLSTVRDAHRILVMDGGRIVEQGSHAELLAADGFYADLYESQFAEPLVEAA